MYTVDGKYDNMGSMINVRQNPQSTVPLVQYIFRAQLTGYIAVAWGIMAAFLAKNGAMMDYSTGRARPKGKGPTSPAPPAQTP